MTKTKQLRKKIAKDGQAKFGYVDWEVETPSTIDRWYEHADETLAAFKAHIEGCEKPENPYPRFWNEHCGFNKCVEAYRKALMESLE